MKVITTNLLNRFWKNGVKPIKDDVAKKLNTSNIINNLLATASGYALDARQGKVLDEKIAELNGKFVFSTHVVTVNINGSYPFVYLPKPAKGYYPVYACNGDWQANSFFIRSIAVESNGDAIVFIEPGNGSNGAGRFYVLWCKL